VRLWSGAAAGRRRLLLSALLALPINAVAARSQAAPVGPVREPGSELTVSLITLGQGDQVWERFGHNALWIHDAARGTDRTYNWGVFDASDAGFIIRFVRGRMRYWLETVDAQRLLDFYRSYDRTITIQRLALSPAQRVTLRDFVEWNAREENKYYWYDYFRDNCSTRLRDAVDRALAGALRRETAGQITPNTYRSESVRLMEGMPLTQLGIAVGLGPLADRKLTAWEEMFVPMRMRDRLREVRIAGADGAPIPLVAEERQVYVSRRPSELQRPPPLLKRYAIVGAIVAAAIAASGLLAFVAWGAPFAAVAAGWSLLSGIAGLLLLFLWLGTHHLFAYRNENLFHLSPIAAALGVLAPLAVYRERARAAAWWLAAAVVALSLLGFVLKALPGFDQDNLFVIALVLPGHVALAWVLLRLAHAAHRRATAP
jgi:uncharacterized protein DUF4105